MRPKTQHLTNKDKVKHVTESLTYFFLKEHWEYLEDDQIKHLFDRIDVDRIEDSALIGNSYIKEHVNWDKVSDKKLVRCAVRLIDNGDIDYVKENLNLKSRNLKIADVFHVIRRKLEMIDFLEIDMTKISDSDAYHTLMLDNNELLDRIDISKHSFSPNQAFDILKTYRFREDVFLKLPYKKFNSYQIGYTLKETGEKYIDKFDINKIIQADWVKVLKKQPDMYSYIDPTIYLEGDVFHLVEMLNIFDYEELHLMMKYRIKELTPYGVERLLIAHYNKYKDLVDLSCLNENNKIQIRKFVPGFGNDIKETC